MKSRNALLLSSLFIIIVLCLSNVNSVYAYSTVQYSRTRYQSYVYSPNLRQNTLQLSSGKYVVTSNPDAYSLRIEIFNPNGNVYYNVTLSSGYAFCDTSSIRRTYGILEYNGYLYIASFTLAGTTEYLRITRIHLVTFVKNDYDFQIASGTDSFKFGEVIYFRVFNNYLYIAYVCSFLQAGTDYTKIRVGKMNPSDNTYTALAEYSRSDYQTTFTMLSFQDSSSGNIYMMISFSGSLQQPSTFKFDIGANTITVLCSAGSNIYPSTGEQLRKIYLISANVVQSGTDLYLYFTYIYPSSGINLKLTSWIQKYTGSISSANLVAQNVIEANIGVSIPSGYPFGLGYNDGYNTTYVYYPYKIGSDKYLMKSKLTLNNFLDPNNAYWSPVYSEKSDDQVLFNNGNEYVFKSNTNDIYQANYDASNSKQYVYCGLQALQINYDIGITYSPMDNPLKTGTSYAFTITCYENNIATKETIRIIWDNVTIGTYETDAGGKKSFTRVEGVSGVHIMNVAIIKNNNDVYDEEFQYTFTVSEEGGAGSSSQLYGSLSMLMMYLPVLATTLVMGSVGAKLSGGFGFVIGSCLGILICCIAGLLPVYFIIFIGIILSIVVMKG